MIHNKRYAFIILCTICDRNVCVHFPCVFISQIHGWECLILAFEAWGILVVQSFVPLQGTLRSLCEDVANGALFKSHFICYLYKYLQQIV
jgi:hypothetical protein